MKKEDNILTKIKIYKKKKKSISVANATISNFNVHTKDFQLKFEINNV